MEKCLYYRSAFIMLVCLLERNITKIKKFNSIFYNDFLRFIYHQPNCMCMPQLERITIFTMELLPINFWHLILEHNCNSVTFTLLLDGVFVVIILNCSGDETIF